MSLTRQEVFQALADGKDIEVTKNLDWVSIEAGYYSALSPTNFNNYKWRIKSEPPKRYENIPKQGVLCWVHDIITQPNSFNGYLTIIKELDIDGSYTDYLANAWFYATPLTNEEIKQFLQGE